ncbi:MAG: hypothetical protein GY839_10215 [candidate division Zixibacteria bacterium]|nr:hypothetical protein [candidate division Zixibacteria bacterium]
MNCPLIDPEAPHYVAFPDETPWIQLINANDSTIWSDGKGGAIRGEQFYRNGAN